MSMTKNKELELSAAYFFWLRDIVLPDIHVGESQYDKLLHLLHGYIFEWDVPNDDNRAMDGIQLRETFTDEYSYIPEWADALEGPCTMLELIIGLAIRWEDTLTDPQIEEDRTADWFWEMIRNTGLDSCTNDVYTGTDDDLYIESIVDRINDRTYAKSGKGGLFPLRAWKKDQRKVELWYQLSGYLNENF